MMSVHSVLPVYITVVWYVYSGMGLSVDFVSLFSI